MKAIYQAIRSYLDAESGPDTAARANLPAMLAFERQNRDHRDALDGLAHAIARSRSIASPARFERAPVLGASTATMLHEVLSTPRWDMPASADFQAILEAEDTTGLLNAALEKLICEFCERVDGTCIAGFAGRVTRQSGTATRTTGGLLIEASLERVGTPLRTARFIELAHPSRTTLLETRARGVAVMNEVRSLGDSAGDWPLFLASEILSLRQRTLA